MDTSQWGAWLFTWLAPATAAEAILNPEGIVAAGVSALPAVPAPSGSGGIFTGWQPWAITVLLLVGLFLIVALLHEVREV
jgi:hypothetical protein